MKPRYNQPQGEVAWRVAFGTYFSGGVRCGRASADTRTNVGAGRDVDWYHVGRLANDDELESIGSADGNGDIWQLKPDDDHLLQQ